MDPAAAAASLIAEDVKGLTFARAGGGGGGEGRMEEDAERRAGVFCSTPVREIKKAEGETVAEERV